MIKISESPTKFSSSSFISVSQNASEKHIRVVEKLINKEEIDSDVNEPAYDRQATESEQNQLLVLERTIQHEHDDNDLDDDASSLETASSKSKSLEIKSILSKKSSTFEGTIKSNNLSALSKKQSSLMIRDDHDNDSNSEIPSVSESLDNVRSKANSQHSTTNDQQVKNLYMLEKSLYSSIIRSASSLKKHSSMSNRVVVIKDDKDELLNKQSIVQDERKNITTPIERPRTRRSRGDSLTSESRKAVEAAELISLSKNSLKTMNPIKINNQLIPLEKYEVDLDYVPPPPEEKENMMNDLRERRPPPPPLIAPPKPKKIKLPAKDPWPRLNLKVSYMFYIRNEEKEKAKKLEHANSQKLHDRKLTREEESKSVLRLNRTPSRYKKFDYNSITNSANNENFIVNTSTNSNNTIKANDDGIMVGQKFYRFKTIHDDPKLKNTNIEAVSMRLYSSKSRKTKNNYEPIVVVKKAHSNEMIDSIVKRLVANKETKIPDSVRTIKSSPYKNSDLVLSHAWKGYN